MKTKGIPVAMAISLLFSLTFSSSELSAQRHNRRFTPEPVKLDNPISVEYLKKNLNKQLPRIALNNKLEKDLKKKLKTDPVIQNVYKSIKLHAETVFEKPIINLDIPMEERSRNNQLDISRDMLNRMNSV